MIITSCGNSENIAKKIASQLKAKYCPLTVASFPDGDAYLRFEHPELLKGQRLVLVQSFQPHPDMSLFDTIFAAETAKDLGAKKIILVVPYLSYMRQDKRFNPGECISSRVMAKLLNHSVDKLITIDPHLHRYRSLKEIFTIPAVNLTANPLLASYIKKHFKNEIIIGPDWESYQWAEDIAGDVKVPVTVLRKTRFSSRHVEEKIVKPIVVKGKNVVIVDDVISTGHTIAEAALKVKKMGAKEVYAVAVHGLFVENGREKLKKAGVEKVIVTNTVEQKEGLIDITSLLVEELKKER